MFRHGQWVKFDPGSSAKLFETAHKSKDGLVVGIYHKSKIDTFGETLNEHIVGVTADGTDAMFFDGKEVHRSTINPVFVKSIEPLLNKADLPPGRIINENWIPRA